MTARTAHGLPASFFDLAMSVVFVFMALFIISTLDTPKPSAGAITPKAEFIAELVWDDDSPDDIDLYARGPDGAVVFFGKRDSALMSLDRDNLGQNNMVSLPDGSRVAIPDRREAITIRAIAPGEYTFNAHAYRKKSGAPTHIKLTVTKLNPFRVVTVAESVLDTERQEVTLATVRVSADGQAEAYLVPVRMVQ